MTEFKSPRLVTISKHQSASKVAAAVAISAKLDKKEDDAEEELVKILELEDSS